MALKTFKEFQAIVKESMESASTSVTESTESTIETTLNEAVDLAAKQKIIDDIAKHALSNEEQKLLDALIDKIAKLRKPKFKIAAKKTEKELKWSDAVEYVKTLGAGWRLPTKEELWQIYNSDNDFTPNGIYFSDEKFDRSVYTQKFSAGQQPSSSGTGPRSWGSSDLIMPYFVRAVKD